ncbi:hypothetical protein MPSEU_000621800 [Mayamaea pseudoterrestris]|nr:hypothetical protein MPSEU_000621800 [Mayamaea pseudoterrestris]
MTASTMTPHVSSPAACSSENMIDYFAPTIREERPTAPKRRFPKTRITKRRGTIEFMASFLITTGNGTAAADEQHEQPPKLKRSSRRKASPDVKPSCPNRRDTMEFVWGSLKHISSMKSTRDVGSSAKDNDCKPIRPTRRGTMELLWGKRSKSSMRDVNDDHSGETEIMSSSDFE